MLFEKALITAFLGCPNPGVQLYIVENHGIIVHNLEHGNMRYVDLDNSTKTLYMTRDVDYKGYIYLVESPGNPKIEKVFCTMDLNPEKKWQILDYKFESEALP